MNNSLLSIENYKENIDVKSSIIMKRYINIINEYLTQCVESIYIKNESYYKYVLNKGINTIGHVFKVLLLYTKNLELTCHHCQKSFYYYIEFIGQIGDDNHSCLQLNSKDACLFVYKKTIFDIDNNYRKNFNNDKTSSNIISNIEKMIQIYNKNINLIINSYQIDNEIELYNYVNDNLEKQINLMLTLNEDETICADQLDAIVYFLDVFEMKDIKRIQYIELFIKKIKKTWDLNLIREKIKNIMHDSSYTEMTPHKCINYIFSN
tara:strand:+ start:631 stop:1422 length:792 start_codon:yes stop_codon:yes gene_type:complete